jgi:hypothetical protein
VQQPRVLQPIAMPRLWVHIGRVRLPRLTDGAYLFWASLTLYFVLAVIMVLQMHLLVGDAWSRVGNAYYVLFSRDPHLAAIGFVWNPLPSLLLLPLLVAAPWWPPLVEQGFAGNIVSVIAMAAAVYQFRGILLDWGMSVVPRIALTVLFAVHPMVVHYGANGDTEALFLLLLLGTGRYLARWVRDEKLGALVVAALLMGLAYWVRYEAAAVGLGVVVLVAGLTYRRTAGQRGARSLAAMADAAIVGAPIAAAFVLWAAASWLIVGNPFEQFQSVYGTTAQLQTGAVFVDATMTRQELMVGQWLGMEPLVVPLLVASLIAAAWTKDARWLVPVVVFGAVLGFSAWAWLTGRTAGWIRYHITIVPLAALVGAYIVARAMTFRSKWTAGGHHSVAAFARAGAWAAKAAVLAGVVVALATAVPSTLSTLQQPVVGRGGREQLDDLPRYLIGQEVATYLDKMQLADGSVLVDVFLGFPIVLSSDNPRQFVITPDRDFQQIVADPRTFGVEYILVPPSGGLAGLDAIKRQWPAIYERGAGLGTLVHEFRTPVEESGFDPRIFNGGVLDSLRWRLYRLNPEASLAGSG